MSRNRVNDLRRSAAVTTSGPGAIVDARAGAAPVSGVHAGLETWDTEAPLVGDLSSQKIYERRLLSKLGKNYFRLAPVVAKSLPGQSKEDDIERSLILRRFPNWLQCPKCSVIKPSSKWSTEPGRAYRYCANCSSNSPGRKKTFVLPVRLVAACVNGHLDDFPWNWWVNHRNSCNRKNIELKLYSKGTGLGGFHLLCMNCGAERGMESAFNKSALKGLSCEGRRPWLDSDDESCECNGESGNYRALQRGASNLYYPIFESALDIPPWTEPIQRLINDYWDNLINIPDSTQRLSWIKMTHSIMESAKRVGVSAEDISSTFDLMNNQSTISSADEIRFDEFKVFNGLIPTTHSEFESHPKKMVGRFSEYIDIVTRVSRLREVRVLTGFTRIRPPQDNSDINHAPLSEKIKDWLPAVEIRGEGIFISLNQEKISTWESQSQVIAHCSEIQKHFQEDYVKRNPSAVEIPVMTPRYLLIHTLAHLLIRQLTFECGYSSASLRERLYVSNFENEMLGLLIYTGTADSDGTLGGLQARGSIHLIESTLLGAIKAASWCSSDPICIEGSMSPSDMFSGASCHSCLLISETSCEKFNKFLDRALIVGTPEVPTIGYFNIGNSNG